MTLSMKNPQYSKFIYYLQGFDFIDCLHDEELIIPRTIYKKIEINPIFGNMMYLNVISFKNILHCVRMQNVEFVELVEKLVKLIEKFNIKCKIDIAYDSFIINLALNEVDFNKEYIFSHICDFQPVYHDNFENFNVNIKDYLKDCEQVVSKLKSHYDVEIAFNKNLMLVNNYFDDGIINLFIKKQLREGIVCEVNVYRTVTTVKKSKAQLLRDRLRKSYEQERKIEVFDYENGEFETCYIITEKCICCHNKIFSYLHKYWPQLRKI